MYDEHQNRDMKKQLFFEQDEREKINKAISEWLTDYMLKKQKKQLLQSLQHIKPQQSSTSNSSTYFNKFHLQAQRIISENVPNSPVQNIYLNLQQNMKLNLLIISYEQKIMNYLINCMKRNTLLQMIKNSKLQLIAKSHHIIKMYKRQQINYKSENHSHADMYYLLDGEIQKIREFQMRQQMIGGKGFKLNLDNLSVSLDLPVIQNQIKLNKRNKLRTLILPGEFIGDEFFCQYTEETARPVRATFRILSQHSTLIKFHGATIRKILRQFHYLEDSQQFYEEKSCIELTQIKSMREFDKKYQSICKKRQQNILKRQLSPEMQEIKKQILKRYKTSTKETDVDSKSPRQMAKILSKRKKKMGIAQNSSFQLPMVQVFETHSQKKRSHQGIALSPLAIVNTRRNTGLLNKSENILSRKEKSQIYQVKSWQSLSQLREVNLSPNMKKVQKLVKQKKHIFGGFQLLEMDRVVEKIRVEIKRK